jgi:hypothetical protein
MVDARLKLNTTPWVKIPRVIVFVLVKSMRFLNQAVKVHDFKAQGKSIWRITQGVLHVFNKCWISHVLRKIALTSQ